MKVYTFSPFGYEGSLVEVEVDLRRGIPAVDIVGLADGQVKETRERVKAAFRNSQIDFPEERVLVSFSPVDLLKRTPMDLAMALAIINQQKPFSLNEKVLVLGELELSGKVREGRCTYLAIQTAKDAGIKKVMATDTLSSARNLCRNLILKWQELTAGYVIKGKQCRKWIFRQT